MRVDDDAAIEAGVSTGTVSSSVMSKLSGTNLVRAADHNQRVVLQAIRVAGTITRARLVEQTGLTQPTVLHITRRLLDRGYVVEAGRRSSGRGVPAPSLAVNPDGCYGLGVNIDRDHVSVVSLDLAGNVRTRTTLEIAFPMPDQVAGYVRREVRRILRHKGIQGERILGMGVAIPGGLGSVDLPHRPAGYEIWNDVDAGALLRGSLPWPVMVENDAAAAAMGEAHFGAGLIHASFFYLLVTAGLGGGLVIDGVYHRGSTERSGRIGFLQTRSGQPLQNIVSLSALNARLEAAGLPVPSPSELLASGPEIDAAVARWIDDAAAELVEPLSAVNCLVDPEAILIGGRLPAPIVDRLAAQLNALLATHGSDLWNSAPVARAPLADDAPAVGAAIMPFTASVLPSGDVLRNTASR